MIKGKRKKEIDGFQQYEISETGRIYSLNHYVEEYDYTPVLSTRIDRGGYITVRLSKEGKTYTKYLHRLLGFAFVPNPAKKKYINHKNGKKWDYTLSNLEWVDHSENVKHAYSIGLIKPKGRRVIDTSSGVVFKNAREASIHYGIKYNTLRNYLNGNIKFNPTSLIYVNL